MLLQPKKTKFKKLKKTDLSKPTETRSFKLSHGSVGLKALGSFRMTSRQIEAIRQCMNREIGRRGKIWINVFPHIPVSATPTENRMGKGKGSISYWCAPIKFGSILFEIDGVPLIKAKQALIKGGNKLSIKTKIVTR